MIDNHLLKEEDIADRVKVARIVQKLLRGALDLPARPWHDWDGTISRGSGGSCRCICNTQILRPRLQN
jgi:hypothetical protein